MHHAFNHSFQWRATCSRRLTSDARGTFGCVESSAHLIKLQKHAWIGKRYCAQSFHSKRRLQKGPPVTKAVSVEQVPPSTRDSTRSHSRDDGSEANVKGDLTNDSEDDPDGGIAAESLQLLEWPILCRQVAAFARTPSTARHITLNKLRLGTSQSDSDELLRQTAEAIDAKLQFEGVYDLQPILSAAEDGRVLNPRQLNALASTLDAAANLTSQLGLDNAETDSHRKADNGAVSQKEEKGRYPSLTKILARAQGGVPDVLNAIRTCIGKDNDLILDEADEDLALLRAEKSEVSAELVSQSEAWARKLFQSKVSEHDRVTQQRGRQCVSVKAGRQGELPRGSIKLGASRSEATIYMQPEPLVELDNSYASLSSEVEEAEFQVLSRLTALISKNHNRLQKVMEALLKMDTVNARACYSVWISGLRPTFYKANVREGPISLMGARHPLLLSKCLEGLPEMPEYDESEFDNSYLGAAKALEQYVEQTTAMVMETEERETQPKEKSLPRAIDLVVPPGKRSVVLTGPNTGGKTASLKTLGLLVLMAKAGLFLPISKPSDTAHLPRDSQLPLRDHDRQGDLQTVASDAYMNKNQQGLVWFREVLADLGDSQDLAQNLSTFSGHIRRVKSILESTTSESLVLLDELGSGTDPVEGGALAAVILEHMAPNVKLCFSTSHHAELKDLPDKDSSFVNACVEFDIKSLKPTYRLLWGQPGDSQALDVAKGLGFDSDIIADALTISQESVYIRNPGRERSEMKRSLVEEVEDAEREADKVHAQRRQVQKQLNELQSKLQLLTKEEQDNASSSQGKAAAGKEEETLSVQRQIKQIMDSFTLGSITLQEAERQLEGLRSAAEGRQAESSRLFGRNETGSRQDWNPALGETVKLLSMGNKLAQVVRSDGKKLTVKMGSIPVEVRLPDIAPAESKSSIVKQKSSRRKSSAPKRQMSNSNKSDSKPSGQLLRVQIPENTADLRGLRFEAAMQELETRIQECPNESVLFVVHGHGTGQLKAGVQKHLKRHALVRKFEFEPKSAGGCTVVELK